MRLAGVVVALTLVVVCALEAVEASSFFEAHRLVQYDRGGSPLGSRRASVSLVASSGKPVPGSAPEEDGGEAAGGAHPEGGAGEEAATRAPVRKRTGDLARNIAVLRLDDNGQVLSSAQVRSVVDKRDAAGLLLVLPDADTLAGAQAARRAAWEELELYLTSREFDVPVYFAFEDEELGAIVDQLDSSLGVAASAHDSFHMEVSSSEAVAVTSVTIRNFQGWHQSTPSVASDSDSVPTIAVVANYDAFAASPELAFGADHNGSGTIALLELARIFGRLYNDVRSHGPSHMLFVLTGAGRLNYAGTKHWLQQADTRVLDSLDFVLCLESLGSAGPLYLHVSKPPKTEKLEKLYGSFSLTAEHMDIPFELVHRRINVSDPTVYWQHEQFSRKRVVAATLSSRASPVSASGLFDRPVTVSKEALARNVKFAADSLAKILYGLGAANQEVVREQDVNKNFVDAWVDFLGKVPRMAGYIDEADSPVLPQIERVLKQHTTDVRQTSFLLDSEYQFYKLPAAVQLSVYSVKSFTFELVFLGATSLYLVGLRFGVAWLFSSS